jgi:hypothetical protein
VATVSDRVAAGAAFLDEHDPEWWRAGGRRSIDLEAIDLESPHLCVLGQWCPVEWIADSGFTTRYDAAAERLSGLSGMDEIDQDVHQVDRWAMPLGFQAEADDDDFDAADIEFKELTAEWRRVIEARRAEAAGTGGRGDDDE